MLELEIVCCDATIQAKEIAIKQNSGLGKSKFKRRVLNAKIEKEKVEIARESYIDLAKQIRERIDESIAKFGIKPREYIVDFLTSTLSIDDIAKKHKVKPRDVACVLELFSKTLCKRIKYLKFNQYFDV